MQMKHRNKILTSLVILAGLILPCIPAQSKPVEKHTALLAGTHFLQKKGLLKQGDTLTLYSPEKTNPYEGCFYVFNNGEESFVIVGADDRCTPILGYSTNGSFNLGKLPANMQVWLDGYAREIRLAIEANAPENPNHLVQWKRLLQTPEGNDEPKRDSYLLTSTWEQGSGYNNYCPVMNGQHVVVGCVATAMAQIIRYHQSPSRGFGKKTYNHSSYGTQSVDFDTTEYDYSLMPDRIRRSSSAAEKDMVSRLCYHCGVVVNMNYQNPSHTSGSGSQTSRIPEGLMHFGYTDAILYVRDNNISDSAWKALIRTEIDNLRPIEYSGVNEEGGHAFVLDGYNNNDQYHFNWGWGGYCDGFYTLTTMQGFTASQDMVINIKPSGWDGHLQQFLVSPDGHGDGTSWENANNDLNAAVKLNKYANKSIWMKEGLYYGDTTQQYAYTLSGNASIYGGFEGTETQVSQRNPDLHPTIIDGKGVRCLVDASCNTYNGTLSLNDLILQNGHSVNEPCIKLSNSIKALKFTIRNCTSDSGQVLYINDGLARCFRIENNNAPQICFLNEAIMRQSLLNNNSGDVAILSHGRIVNCDIVSNTGTAVVFQSRGSSLINTIVWNNDTTLRLNTDLNDTSVRYCAFDSDTALGDSTCLLLSHDNNAPNGPAFILPATTRGVSLTSDSPDYNWQLAKGSVCIDAGERVLECIRDGDMNQEVRCRNGKIDLGCYESNYPVGISQPTADILAVHPNPASNHITVSTPDGTTIQILDMTGRQILSQPSRHGETLIDISSLPQGIYLLKSGTQTAKLIKK